MSESFLEDFEGVEEIGETYEGLTKLEWVNDALMYGKAQAGFGSYESGKRIGTADTNGAILTAFFNLAIENGGKYMESCDGEACRRLGELFDSFVVRNKELAAEWSEEGGDTFNTGRVVEALVIAELGENKLSENELREQLLAIIDEMENPGKMDGGGSLRTTMQWRGQIGRGEMVAEQYAVMTENPLSAEQEMAVTGPMNRLWNWFSQLVKF